MSIDTKTAPASRSTQPSLDLREGLRDRDSYLHELECARGWAILLVFVFHAWGISGLQMPASPWPGVSFIAVGSTGVTLFFVLSGFLLSLPWLRHAADPTQRKPQLRPYLRARALRIIPLYYIALVLTWAFTGDSVTVARAALFQFIGFDAFPYGVVWWTLATEMQFYLVLPLGMTLWIGSRTARLCCLALILFWLALYAGIVLGGVSEETSFVLTKSLFARAPAFLIGILSAAFWLHLKHRSASANTSRMAGTVSLAMLFCALAALERILLAVALMGNAAETRWHIHHTYEALLWAAILLLLLRGPMPAKPLFVNRPLAVMGKLSYSLYLLHVPVLFYSIYPAREKMGIEAYINSPWLYLIPLAAFAVSLGLALCSYHGLEKPFLQRKRALTV